jgi:hypothetical protein
MEYSLDVMEEIENLRKEERIAKAKQEAKKIYYKGRYEALPFWEKKLIYMLFKKIFPFGAFSIIQGKINTENFWKQYIYIFDLKFYESLSPSLIKQYENKVKEDEINVLAYENGEYQDKEKCILYFKNIIESDKNDIEKIKNKENYKIIRSVNDFLNLLILEDCLEDYKEKNNLLENFYKKYPFMEIYEIQDIINEYERSEKEYKENL